MSEIYEKITAGKPWPEHYTFAPAMRVGNTIWLSGTTGTDENGKITAPGLQPLRQVKQKRKLHQLRGLE